ncbi:magnesium transporter [Solibacillus sp. FSL K6-1523]|uniref:magnesium transporter n=1 Tax=Solibacillus sp. FSL K6-1523 TaxID=2921471 RepID=UPI0030F4C3BA
MSYCSFIATNFEMPEVESRVKSITAKEAIELGVKPNEFVPWENIDPDAQILYAENEDDLNELVVTKDTYYNVSGYTSYPFTYEVTFGYSESRLNQLLEYLKENIKEDQIIELWRVWIGHDNNDLNIPYSRYSFGELTLDQLLQMYDRNHEQYKEEYCIVLER